MTNDGLIINGASSGERDKFKSEFYDDNSFQHFDQSPYESRFDPMEEEYCRIKREERVKNAMSEEEFNSVVKDKAYLSELMKVSMNRSKKTNRTPANDFISKSIEQNNAATAAQQNQAMTNEQLLQSNQQLMNEVKELRGMVEQLMSQQQKLGTGPTPKWDYNDLH